MTKSIITATFVLAILPITGGMCYSQDIKLQNRSSFSNEEGARNPFWPLGWRPKGAVMQVAPENVAFSLSPNVFSVTSILLGENPLAVINGKEYMEGEQIAIQVGNQVVKVQIHSIQDGAVVFRYQEKDITAPLQRK